MHNYSFLLTKQKLLRFFFFSFQYKSSLKNNFFFFSPVQFHSFQNLTLILHKNSLYNLINAGLFFSRLFLIEPFLIFKTSKDHKTSNKNLIQQLHFKNN